MTSVPPLDYEQALDLNSALDALAQGGTPMHGGTELLPAMGMGLLLPEKVVSVSSVSELKVCDVKDGSLLIGAGLTHLEISASEQVRSVAPLVADVTDGVGNIRVRATGTLGGNLIFAEPRSDLTTVLLALEAEVRLASAAGARTVALAEFLLGPYEVDLRPGELLVSVALRQGAADFSVYRKIVVSERPVVGVALAHLTEPKRWRLVIGAVGLSPTIVEAGDLSQLDPRSVAADVDVTRDLSGGEEYKRHLTAVTVERCRAAAAAFVSRESAK